MINLTAIQLAEIVLGQVIGDSGFTIRNVITDSRVPVSGNGSMFIALVGPNHNGHEFIGELYNIRNIKAYLVEKGEVDYTNYPNATFVEVDDTLQALQKLAAYHRNRFVYPVIGITGSNGKTIVKEWLNQLLFSEYQIVRSPRSYNSQVGVPLSVLQMDNHFDLAIFEAGISKPGEMVKLQPIIDPTIGIFTNIGMPHQENFDDIDEKVNEKLKLFREVKTLIYCKDHAVIDAVVQDNTLLADNQLLTWGQNKESKVQIMSVKREAGKTLVHVRFNNHEHTITIPFTDAASFENAMHCVATMLLLGYSLQDIDTRLQRLQPVAMRLELKEGINDCSVINDSYNSDLGSLAIAIDFLMQQKQHERHVVILSDILESGYAPEQLYSKVAQMLEDKGVDLLIGIGPEISRYDYAFEIEAEFYSSTHEFLLDLKRKEIRDAAILVKGSRKFHFEQISAALERKVHRTTLEINLNAIAHNLNYYRSLLNPGVKVMAMVKAFSYGSGSYEIANLLQFQRVDYLGVAYTDEGVSLREAGISLPIVVLNPSFGTYELMVEFNLEPEIYNITGLKEFINVLNRVGVSSYGIHIKIDSGMHRLGFTPDQLDELIAILKSTNSVRVKSIFSHLAASDEPHHDQFTIHQIETFHKACNVLSDVLGYQPIRHILNTGGIERYPEAQFEMVRLGIGLYGISPTHGDKLMPISTLRSKVIQVKQIKPGDTVGYSRKGIVDTPTTVVTIPVGYADGLSRMLGNGNYSMMLNGTLVPTIGNISMDTCTLNANGVEVKEGDEVIVFGNKPTITDMAKAMETIPYEVLTSISQRVKRVYFQE
ncbi:MAG TPA: bifunctional UDP-N-acetylmuramoyl-tripeptide:D-alanyl-D-alanine ligase/alanine racemase [Tenuifilum sp.]|uniref:bifunctional UDP-N-acetylmuramoyl-tripeptide:D-alanyl-D-alanine ligase/alanine racemase n=2 Tax=Tenuifilum sp. TaxID=2760880 RepID=UPI001B4EAC9E|nr:bifunctional UDP-N-acetylmuramoyl-tripeptide:D-alanyl-D-alanine ligase/alanine racemase [Bacteroidales bacterium]HON69505.1 bifunctional UDP-N-acetylmuramoyl-tripeptide:D-alanyl-D-alanine ligase/alanine racemase [Tenuifilum sp.]HOU73220.1 bifunctional UDP-N-acetylmuramoyl-tripeptide:D-alanyl-D-alanine ligase/alanine racemase [Tenuifilum sp.]HQG71507.1 bifunctional UDP-N-acetylmuramoyl-tripeptide:D-alanyl-D-alanine ligase/alanine racemase [Tenuifilum sp.]HQI88351.1 bifunctional UDP-N-acetylmu